jgi:catalase
MSHDQNPNQALKIVLTRPALERLIGDDAQMQVVLTHAAVQEVIERHMQTITKAVDEHIKHILDASFGRVAVVYEGYKHVEKFELSPTVKTRLSTQVKPLADEYVKNSFAAIDDLIAKAVDESVKHRINAAVSTRVRDIVNKAAAATTE